MASSSFGFKMDSGWKRFSAAFDTPKFKRKFQRHRHIAFDAIARVIIKQAIERGSFARNAALTEMIKGGNTPLEDTGKKLSRALTTRLTRNEMFIGVPVGDEFYQTARTLHEGATIKVTPKMREMFILLWLASDGGIAPSSLTGRAAELFKRQSSGWLPLRESTKAIKIPARPFIDEAFNSAEARAMAELAFTNAVNRTIAEMAQ